MEIHLGTKIRSKLGVLASGNQSSNNPRGNPKINFGKNAISKRK